MCGCLSDAEPAIVSPVDADGRPLLLARSLLGGALATDVTAAYCVTDRVLGRGSFATTRLCVEKATGRELACKSILKRRLEGLSKDWADVRREVQAMHHLKGHPNVARLEGTFECDDYVHLVMELCPGGDLLERVVARGPYPEREAAAIVRALLEAVAYAHDMGCAHRDIKLENLLLAVDDAPDGAEVDFASALRLVDFGFAEFVRPRRKLKGLCGTSYYIAPEVIMGPYDERADIWSCGVVLYILLCGRPPFHAQKTEGVFRQILDDGLPEMAADPWPRVSDAAKDAVRRMMTWFPRRRPTAREMLHHGFLLTGPQPTPAGLHGLVHADFLPPAEPEVLARMRSFAAMGALKRHAALAVASQLPLDEIMGLAAMFDTIDLDGNGTITLDELRKALEARGARPPADELDALMAVADINGDGELDYAEFLATTLHSSRLEEEANMLLAFKHFDRDGNGRISADELHDALAAAGDATSVGDVADIIRQVDQDGNGEIDYGEFADAMRGRPSSSSAATSSQGSSDCSTCAHTSSASDAPGISAGGSSASTSSTGAASSAGGSVGSGSGIDGSVGSEASGHSRASTSHLDLSLPFPPPIRTCFGPRPGRASRMQVGLCPAY